MPDWFTRGIQQGEPQEVSFPEGNIPHMQRSTGSKQAPNVPAIVLSAEKLNDSPKVTWQSHHGREKKCEGQLIPE